MAPKKTSNRRPCSKGRTSGTSSKFSKGSSQSQIKSSIASRKQKRTEQLECLRECRVMLTSDRDALQTEEKSTFKPKKNVLQIERDATLQNAVQQVNILLQNRVCWETEYNLKKNEILAEENEKILQEDNDDCNLEDDQLASKQEARHIMSQRNEISSGDSNAEQGRINVKNEYTVSRCVPGLDGKSIDLATNGSSANVMKIKLPGTNTYRTLDCVASDTAERNLLSVVEDHNREESLSLPTHTINDESILGIAVIEPETSNGSKRMNDAAKIFSTTIDLEDSSSELDISRSDVCDHKISKSDCHRSNMGLEMMKEIDGQSDAQTIESKIPNVKDSELQCTRLCEVQSGRPANCSVGFSGKNVKVTAIYNNDYNTLEELELSEHLEMKDYYIDDENSRTVPHQDYLETPFLGLPKGGLIDTKVSSLSSPEEVGKSSKSLKSVEKTKLDGVEISIGKTCSRPVFCTCSGCQFSPQRDISVCDHTSGYCVVRASRSGCLNQSVVLPIDQSSTDVEKDENCAKGNLALSIHINLGSLIQAKQKRACCHSSDVRTSEHQKWQTPVHDRIRKKAYVYAKKSETKNVKGLLPCRSCSFRAISETILEQHAGMHEQLLSTGYAAYESISADAEQIPVQTLSAERTDELMVAKGKRSIPGVLLLTNATQSQAQNSLPVIVNNTEVSNVHTSVEANPSSPAVILENPKNALNLANTFVMADPLLRDSKNCHEYSNSFTSKPKYNCKYCSFSFIKQQKQANHMRYCHLSTKMKQCGTSPRRSRRRRALLGAFEADSSPTRDKSNAIEKIMSSGAENAPTIIKEEPKLDAVSSQPANTTESTSRDIKDRTINLSTKKLPYSPVPGAYREVLHKCNLCDFTTVVMDSLTRHGQHNRHTNDPDTLLCPMCAYEATDTAEMRLHFSQSCVHGPAYCKDRVGMKELNCVGDLEGMEGELEIIRLRDTMEFCSEKADPLETTNADETEAIRTVEQCEAAEKFVKNSSPEVSANERQLKPTFPCPEARNLLNNDAVALSSITSVNANHFHRRLLKGTNVASTKGRIRCSKPGCKFVTLHLKGLKSHERSKNHVCHKLF